MKFEELRIRSIDLSAPARAWLVRRKGRLEATVVDLIEFAAGAREASRNPVDSPWGRELVAWLRGNIVRAPGETLSSAQLVAAFAAHCIGRFAYPGDKKVQRALVPLMLALFDCRRRNDIRVESKAVAVRGWRGLRLRSAAAPSPSTSSFTAGQVDRPGDSKTFTIAPAYQSEPSATDVPD